MGNIGSVGLVRFGGKARSAGLVEGIGNVGVQVGKGWPDPAVEFVELHIECHEAVTVALGNGGADEVTGHLDNLAHVDQRRRMERGRPRNGGS